jgi:hypothetical protein
MRADKGSQELYPIITSLYSLDVVKSVNALLF